MLRHCGTGLRRWLGRAILAFAVVAAAAQAAQAQWPQAVRVEEDWELVITTPDPNTDAPQVTTVISPVGNLEWYHSAFEVNHQSQPAYVAGGLGLQVWEGEVPLVDRVFPNPATLSSAGEVIRWTQCMRLEGENLVFEVLSGSSQTWGAFGGQGYLRASIATELSNLNGYNPDVSVANSGVSFGGNRVQSLVLKRVRVYTSHGAVLTFDVERTVHTL